MTQEENWLKIGDIFFNVKKVSSWNLFRFMLQAMDGWDASEAHHFFFGEVVSHFPFLPFKFFFS